MRNIAIELADVTFAWKGAAAQLRISRMNVAVGERVFLQGASGSGKSTLLGLIGGVLTPRTGEIRVLGTPLHAMRGSSRDTFRAAHLGFIFQMFNLIPYLNVMDNVVLPLRFSPERRARLQGTDARAEAARLLEALGLADPDLIARPVTQLSIGQQQRVAAARALIGTPPIVIADEPTSSLDADARSDFLRLLMSECAAHRTTLLFVSHDATLGSQFDRTIHMNELNAAQRRAA